MTPHIAFTSLRKSPHDNRASQSSLHNLCRNFHCTLNFCGPNATGLSNTCVEWNSSGLPLLVCRAPLLLMDRDTRLSSGGPPQSTIDNLHSPGGVINHGNIGRNHWPLYYLSTVMSATFAGTTSFRGW